jgi:ribose transport system substrate-binding protein
MKKMLLVGLLALVMLAQIFAGGAKEPAKATGGEATAAKALDPNAIDPWIAEKRKAGKPFITTQVRFKGIGGEVPVYDDQLVLTNAEVAKLRAGKYKAAYVDNNTAGEYSLAIIGGARETLKYLGIEMIAETSANFDAGKQKSDVESVLAMKPNLVIGYPVDPTTGAEVFKPVVDAGLTLVIVSNRPHGYTPGKEYIAVSTNNPYDNGWNTAKMMIDAIPADGEVGLILYQDEYFVLNVMDQAVKDCIKEFRPKLTVRTEGYVDWNTAGEKATALMQKYPKIQAMYTTWFDPAMVAASDLKAIDRRDVKIYTFGMNTPALLDLLDAKGNIKGLTTDLTWNVGMNTAILGAYGLLKKMAPEMVVVPNAPVTPDNLREIWAIAYTNVPLPKEVDEALNKQGK